MPHGHAALLPNRQPARSIAGFFSNLAPLFVAWLSAAFLGELPHVHHALAFVLIVDGIVASSRR